MQDFFNGLLKPAFTFELLQLSEIESAILCHVAEHRVFSQVRYTQLGFSVGDGCDGDSGSHYWD